MHQLTQNLKDGKMQVLEVPYPALHKGQVLVRNHYSVISAGTEGKRVKEARMNLVAKAQARKEDVKKVINAARQFGIKDTYKMVMNKLDAPSALGYSCAGEVIAVAEDVKAFKVGDHVACGGNAAVHAEVVAVPKNLCVKVDPAVEMKYAAFATIGAIALQGIRQADLRLGESCVVIGMGLVGQLTAQMLKASGVKTIGIDIDAGMIQLASDCGVDLSLDRNRPDVEQQVLEATGGHGADAVIITAGSTSTDPVNLAGALCRKKGKVVIVGGVPTGFDRPNYFKKELDLRMSTSYGPGRYDPNYEEKGEDYPIGYVRWTENRNMQAFVELIRTGGIDLDKLVTHVVAFEQAKDAYDIIVSRTEPFVGMVLQYDLKKELSTSVTVKERTASVGQPVIGLIGAGSFGQNFLLPAMKGHGRFGNVATSSANNARNIADKWGFEHCTTDAKALISEDHLNTIFIATRHDSHAELVLESLRKGRHVFVEKPLCMKEEELALIKEAYENSSSLLMVGFNRRFAPMVEKIKTNLIADTPVAIHMRINAGIVPPEHWIHDPEVGGGRIIGEACHFIDLAQHFAGALITEVSAMGMSSGRHLNDTVNINLSFANGSIATVSYFSNGSKKVPKEYIEVFSAGQTFILDDYKLLRHYGDKLQETKSSTQDKGHQAEVAAFLQAITKGQPAPITFEELYTATSATLKVLESISLKGEVVSV